MTLLCVVKIRTCFLERVSEVLFRPQSVKHEVNHGDVDDVFRCLGELLVILGQPSLPSEPPECSFSDPPLRQDDELVFVLSPYDFKGCMEMFLNPVFERTLVGSICKNL